jgi:hypothetical protein
MRRNDEQVVEIEGQSIKKIPNLRGVTYDKN